MPLAPEQAICYLEELHPALDAAVILDRSGKYLAGHTQIAGLAWDLLSEADAATQIEVRVPAGYLFAVRDRSHALIVVLTKAPLPALVLHDLRTTLVDMGKDRTESSSS